MSIAFGAALGNNSNSGATTLSTATITVSGNNTIGFAYVYSQANNITGATWNGVAMTLVTTAVNVADTVALFYIVAPSTGVVTASRSGSAGRIQVVGSYYTGASQTGIPDASTTNTNATSSNISTNLSSIANQCWFILAGYGNGGGWTASAGATNRDTEASAGGLFDSNGPQSSGSYTMAATTSSGNNTVVMVSFAPAPGISFDNAANGQITSNSVLSIALTVGSGSNRIVWFGFIANKLVIPPISTVTFGGVAMTPTADSPVSDAPSSTNLYLYFLVNPPTGSNNAVATFTTAPDGISGSVVSYYGASQTSVPSTNMMVTGSGSSATLTTTTIVSNAWIVGLFRNDSTGNGTAGTGTTQRSSIAGQNSFDDNNGLATTPGSYSIQETFSSTTYGAIGASFAPFTVTTNASFLLKMI